MPRHILLLRFAFVGGSTGVIFLGLTYTLVESLGVAPALGSTIGCVIAICYNYLLHYHWTFGSSAPHGSALARYLAMCAGGLLLNAAIVHFGTQASGQHYYMAVQLLAAFALACWSLSLSYLWVFRSNAG